MNQTQKDFFLSNDIKWFPILLHNKTPQSLHIDCYKRIKISDGTISYTPNFIEFKTIDNKTLKKRQELFADALENNVIDTYRIAQIDIDTPNVNQEWLCSILQNAPYYKSLTKAYGYHIFVNLSDFKPTKTVYHFKAVFQADDDFQECRLTPDEDEGKVELLTGKWGYIKSDTVIHNADKSPPSIIDIQKCLIDRDTSRKNIDTSRKNIADPPPAYDDIEPTMVANVGGDNPLPYLRLEINDHMLNIDQKYIDSYHTHIKIVNAILRTGYDEIAHNCMYRSSNTQNKDLKAEYNKFKTAKLYDITPKTLFYYSKISNKEAFFKINQKYQYHQLKEQGRKALFELCNITQNIETPYLPKDLITKHMNTDKTQIIHIQSPMGTGKTTMMKHYLDQYPDKTVLYLSPRRTFSNDVFADLQYSGFSHYKHIQKYQDNNDGETPKRIICQMESLHKVKNQTYEIVIIDEIESDLTQLVSTETNKKFFENHRLFERFIQDANKVISMDAFLSRHSCDTINNIKPNTETITIRNTHQTKKEWKAIEIDKFKDLRIQAVADLEEGKKVVFVCGIKKHAYDLLQQIDTVKYKTKIYTGTTSDKEKRFNNINEEWAKLDCLIYTGVITCGVSFNPPTAHFDTVYCYISPNGSTARDMHQAIQRVRKFKIQRLYFCVDKSSSIFKKEFLSTDIMELRNNVNQLIAIKRVEHGETAPLEEWAINNYVFNHYTKHINYLYQLALFCEYLRVQGYEILYCDYSNGIKWDAYAQFRVGSVDTYEKSNLTAEMYEEINKRCYNMTEDEKHKVKCYRFEKQMKWVGNDTETLSHIYKHFRNQEGFNRFNLMFKPEQYDKDNDSGYESGFKELTDLTTSVERIQYKKIKELCGLLGCNDVYKLDYDTFTLTNKQEVLLNWIGESEPLFNFRKTRGDEPIRYINSIIKYVSEGWCGLILDSNRTQKNVGKEVVRYRKYCNYMNKKKEKELYSIFKSVSNL